MTMSTSRGAASVPGTKPGWPGSGGRGVGSAEDEGAGEGDARIGEGDGVAAGAALDVADGAGEGDGGVVAGADELPPGVLDAWYVQAGGGAEAQPMTRINSTANGRGPRGRRSELIAAGLPL